MPRTRSQAVTEAFEASLSQGSGDGTAMECDESAATRAPAGPVYYPVFQPATHAELRARLSEIAQDQSPTKTAEEIARAISARVKKAATNNRATWRSAADAEKQMERYKAKARAIDDDEWQMRASAPEFDDEADWHIDCGLMASLVARHGAGNCDDLASFALDQGMKSSSECVLCFVQHTSFDHSFVLVYCKGDDDVWLSDTWVKEDRVAPFRDSLWGKEPLECNVMVVKVSAAGPGVIDEWERHAAESMDIDAVSDEHPRMDQVGRYTHPSAVHATFAQGLGGGAS